LESAAKRQGLDLLLLIDVDSQIVGIHRKWETTLKVKILDFDDRPCLVGFGTIDG